VRFTGVLAAFKGVCPKQNKSRAARMQHGYSRQGNLRQVSLRPRLWGRVFVLGRDGHFDLCTLFQTDFLAISV
jgi:hypothetical protein